MRKKNGVILFAKTFLITAAVVLLLSCLVLAFYWDFSPSQANPLFAVLNDSETNETISEDEDTAVKAEQSPAPAPEMPVTLIFTGDVMLDSSVRSVIEKNGLDSVFPADYREPFINADITMVNLELPFSTRGEPMEDKQYTYRGKPEYLQLLSDMGVDIVSLANNHVLDYGETAFLDTLDYLAERGIRYTGAGRDMADAMKWELFEVHNRKIAVLAASRVVPVVEWYAGKNRPGVFGTYDPAILNEQIGLVRDQADFVVVFLHWGKERVDFPEEYQVKLAHGYIDNGADVVIGCHPHVLQGFEFYQGKLIAYSLGNFIFSDSSKETAALSLTLKPDGDLSIKLLPFEITNRATAAITDTEKLEKLLERLNSLSMNAEVTKDFEIIEIH